ncbi:MAG TPA: glycosyltransferase family 2 protein [Gemmatimonadaceae bacterium]|nr:glycosyltransferase family 2 protein [Gemmatimonadaceae bacterium]
MLYICIPSYDEAPTVGVLLWRIRKVFQEYSREYEILVYDDASDDGTRETLDAYAKVMPIIIIDGHTRVGYARAVDALLHKASERTKYPRRDAVVLMQADFTDQPEHLPELVKRFEGGADVVIGDRVLGPNAPAAVRKLAKITRWLPALWPIRRFVTVPGVKDPFGGLRLLRITVVRELLAGAGPGAGDRAVSDAPVCATSVGLLHHASRLARRVEIVPLESRWDIRTRESRVRPWPDALALVRHGWATRSPRNSVAAA